VVFKYSILTATLFAGIASAQVTAPGGSPSRPNCESLRGLIIPPNQIELPTGGATVTSATLVAATPQTVAPTGDIVLPLPEHCRVQGTIAPVDPNAPVINFNVNLLSNWNQKAMHSGGGFHGFVATAPGQKGSGYFDSQPFFDPYPLTRGYVTFGGDSGHVGGNAVFALNDEALQNFGYASLKKTHDVAVEIIKQAYGPRHRYMYFNGESNGGRDALIVAQRFPKDYDGIIATSPVLAWTINTRASGVGAPSKSMAAG
jgi:Tannase and feruloyl esterase